MPGLVAGLQEAHRRFGSVPWPQLVEPAIGLAALGLDATEAQLFLHMILAGILQRDEGGRRIYGDPERIETHDFVATLERVRDAPSEAVVELIPELADDIAKYRVAEPEPLRTRIDGLEVLTTPALPAAAPSSRPRSSASPPPRRSPTAPGRSATATPPHRRSQSRGRPTSR